MAKNRSHFPFTLPEGWRGVQAIYLSPEQAAPKPTGLPTLAKTAAFRDNLAFHVAPRGELKAQEYLDALMKAMNHKGVKKEIEVLPDGARAEVINEAPGGARIRQFLHAVQRDQEAWVLTYSFADGTADIKEKRAFFEELVASLAPG